MVVLGCDGEIEKYKPEPNVYCIMRTDQTAATLLAGMTAGYFDSVPDTYQWQGTAGVVAKVVHRGAETVLHEIADSAGYYRADSLMVVPGDSYAVSLAYPSGATVTGSTVVPDTFGVDSLRAATILEVPWPGDTFPSVSVAYFWHQAAEPRDTSAWWTSTTGRVKRAPSFAGAHYSRRRSTIP